MDNHKHNLADLLENMAEQLKNYLSEHKIEQPLIVGMQRSGVWLAQELQKRLGLQEPIGELNVSFYRDDFNRSGLPVQMDATRLPFSLEDRHVILVDDVIQTGRTVRAAMNELFDYGRLASIILAVVVARETRELPIEPQICALYEEPGKNFIYHIAGPEPLTMQILPRN